MPIYRIPASRHNLCRSPRDEDWTEWSRQFRTEQQLIDWTWGHLPERELAQAVEDFRRFQRGLGVAISLDEVQRLAEAIAEHWRAFGPVILKALFKTKMARSRLEPMTRAEKEQLAEMFREEWELFGPAFIEAAQKSRASKENKG